MVSRPARRIKPCIRRVRRGPRTNLKGHWLDIEHHNRYALLLQQLHNGPSDTASTSCDENNLLGPVVVVVDPIVADLVRDPAARPSSNGQPKEHVKATVGGGVVALGVEAGEEHEGKRKAGFRAVRRKRRTSTSAQKPSRGMKPRWIGILTVPVCIRSSRSVGDVAV